MLKDDKKKDYQRDYMKRKRSNTGSNKGDGSNTRSNIGISRDAIAFGNTEWTHKGVTQLPKHHPLLLALVDPNKRLKLEKVCRSLKDAKQDKNIYYGHPYNGLSFDLVYEMLECTG